MLTALYINLEVHTAMRLSAGGARNTASNCCASAGLIKSSLGSGGRGGGGLAGLVSAV